MKDVHWKIKVSFQGAVKIDIGQYQEYSCEEARQPEASGLSSVCKNTHRTMTNPVVPSVGINIRDETLHLFNSNVKA